MIRSLMNPRGVLLAGACILAAGCSSPPPQTPAYGAIPPTPGVVGNVIAPDTVNVMVGPHPMVVRILGIETPRITTQSGPGGCGWPQALNYAKQMLANTHVTLIADPAQPTVVPQNRDLRYLRLPDGSDYSLRAVSAGWARADLDPRHPLQEDAQLRAAQRSAQVARRELWGICPAPTAS